MAGSIEWLDAVVAERNAAREAKGVEERAVLGALAVRPLAASREWQARVSRSPTLRVVGKTYSAPSKLRGEVVVRLPRLSGHAAHRIGYRHVVHALVSKPGALRRYAYQDALCPSRVCRQAYDALIERSDTWADLEYVRIVSLAATTMETLVAEALEGLLGEGATPTFEAVRGRMVAHGPAKCPDLDIATPDLTVYDRLVGAGAEVTT